MDSLKIVSGRNHYKFTGRISNKSGSLSKILFPRGLLIKQKTNYPNYSRFLHLNSNVKMIREVIK